MSTFISKGKESLSQKRRREMEFEPAKAEVGVENSFWGPFN